MEGKPKEFGSILPYAVREFANADLEWLLHRQIYTRAVDVVQLEYTALGQYHFDFQRIACLLFEHDVYFQSIGRGLARTRSLMRKTKSAFEYLRALRYELNILPQFDRIQVCSPENGDYLLSFLPDLGGQAGRRSRRYRKLRVMISSRMAASRIACFSWGAFAICRISKRWTGSRERVLPRILERSARARLVIVGADPPPKHSLPDLGAAIELRGFVEDVREPLSRYAVFVCPILSGSGMRVKLLEAFAAGIPVVSTRLGAEGLTAKDGDICALADIARRIRRKDPGIIPRTPRRPATRPNAHASSVVATRDMGVLTGRLLDSYRKALLAKQNKTGMDADQRG